VKLLLLLPRLVRVLRPPLLMLETAASGVEPHAPPAPPSHPSEKHVENLKRIDIFLTS
jgi:hypothetical protein